MELSYNKEIIRNEIKLKELKNKIKKLENTLNKHYNKKKLIEKDLENISNGNYENLLKKFEELKKSSLQSIKEISSPSEFINYQISTKLENINKMKKKIKIIKNKFEKIILKGNFIKNELKKIDLNLIKEEINKYSSKFLIEIYEKNIKNIEKIEFNKEEELKLLNKKNELLNYLFFISKPIELHLQNYNNLSIKPNEFMEGFITYERSRLIHIHKQLGPSLKSYLNLINKSDNLMDNILNNYNKNENKFKNIENKINIIFNKPLSKILRYSKIKPPNSHSIIRLNYIQKKNYLKNIQNELKDINSGDSNILNMSPELLLKKYKNLLEEQARIRRDYKEKIEIAKTKLNQTTIIKRSRINSLRKTNDQISNEFFENLMN